MEEYNKEEVKEESIEDSLFPEPASAILGDRKTVWE